MKELHLISIVNSTKVEEPIKLVLNCHASRLGYIESKFYDLLQEGINQIEDTPTYEILWCNNYQDAVEGNDITHWIIKVDLSEETFHRFEHEIANIDFISEDIEVPLKVRVRHVLTPNETCEIQSIFIPSVIQEMIQEEHKEFNIELVEMSYSSVKNITMYAGILDLRIDGSMDGYHKFLEWLNHELNDLVDFDLAMEN